MAPTVHKCAFCGYDIAPGTGSSYVRRDGRVLRFCSSKCRKSMVLMRRDARKFKWTTSWGQQR